MIEISTDLIEEAVYNLCFNANIVLNDSVYSKISSAYQTEKNLSTKNYLKNILQNAQTAYKNKMPLCQDTGQVLVFLEIGQNVILKGRFIEDVINSAVENCYRENFFRKSIVENAVFNRINTKTNTPCTIYTTYTNKNDIKINVLIKGAGSENKSKLKMLLPTLGEEEIIKQCADMIIEAGLNSCPPMFIGIGIGATADKALITSKEALFKTDFTKQEKNLAKKILKRVNKYAPKGFENCYALDVKLKTLYTHIACMPAAVTINCHSDRFSQAVIDKGQISYNHKIPEFMEFKEHSCSIKEVKADDISSLKKLKAGEKILLTGEIYTARDSAHKKLVEMIKNNEPLPFDLKDKIIFYAGPCPNPPNKVTGSIGPTTAERMDKYAIELYKKGVFATIGKGDRGEELQNYIQKSGKKYFTVQGGIAALLAQKVKQSEVIAFDELGTEAIRKIYVEKFPLTLSE